MQNDLDNWKSSNLEAITDTLDNVKDIASDNADYSEIKSMIETLKEDIYNKQLELENCQAISARAEEYAKNHRQEVRAHG